MVENAQAELAASLCVHKFTSTDNAEQNLAALKAMTTGARHDYVKLGGWAKLPGLEKSIPGAASLCAKELAAIDRHQVLKNIPSNSGI